IYSPKEAVRQMKVDPQPRAAFIGFFLLSFFSFVFINRNNTPLAVAHGIFSLILVPLHIVLVAFLIHKMTSGIQNLHSWKALLTTMFIAFSIETALLTTIFLVFSNAMLSSL